MTRTKIKMELGETYQCMEKIRLAEKERRQFLLGPSVSYHLNFE